MATGADTLQSVARALGLLEAIAEAPSSSAQQLANAQALRPATTYHLLNTLLAYGYVLKDGRGYRLGPRIGVLAQALERDLQPDQKTMSVVRHLAERAGETVYLSRWQQGDVVITAVAEGRHPVRVSGVHVGLRGHAFARASGKALLAFGPAERLTGYLATASLEALTPNTRVTTEGVMAELERTRERGYAVDEEEFTLGVCCVAVPVGTHRPSPPSLALTVSLPATRFPMVRDEVVTALHLAARELEGDERGTRPSASTHAPTRLKAQEGGRSLANS